MMLSIGLFMYWTLCVGEDTPYLIVILILGRSKKKASKLLFLLLIHTGRHFWLQTKLEPNELDKPNNDNKFYKFKALKPVSTNETRLIANNPEEYLKKQHGFDYEIDGLLFYHVGANYKGGSTPLVNWVPRESIDMLL
jgi:hypothetical protein